MPWDDVTEEDWADFEDDFEDEDEDEDEDELDEYEAEDFINDIGEMGVEDDYDGKTVIATFSMKDGSEYAIRIPAEYIPDLLGLADDLDIDIDFETG